MKTKPIFTLFVFALFALALSACGALDVLQTDEHQSIPQWPVYSQSILDCNTGVIATNGELIQPALGCDSWQLNRYERPFNASNQDEYYANLDILSADLGSDGEWFYLRITPYDLAEGQPLAGLYGLEMDLGMEGRGDYLVLADLSQLDENWDVLGVQVFADSNDDVGNQVPREPDLLGEIDGYDLDLFNQGTGVDKDFAWARTVNDIRPAIEIAFKTDLVSADATFKWWVWSDDGVEQPNSFDYHDAIAHEAAGDVYQGQQYFPSNEIYALDNTCANIWGAPLTDDPSLCNSEVVSTPGSGEVCLPPLSFESWREAFLLSLLSELGGDRQIATIEGLNENNGGYNHLVLLDKSEYQEVALGHLNQNETYLQFVFTELDQAESNEQGSSQDDVIMSRDPAITEELLDKWLQIRYREYLESTDCAPPDECPPHFTFWEFILWVKGQQGPAQIVEASDQNGSSGDQLILQHTLIELVPDNNGPVIQEVVDPAEEEKQNAQKIKELFLLYILYLEELGCEPPGICPPDLTFEDFVELFTPPSNGNDQSDNDSNAVFLPVQFEQLQPQEQAQVNSELISMNLVELTEANNDIQIQVIITPDDSMSYLQDMWELWLLINECEPPDDYPDLECPEPTFAEWKDWLFTKYPQWINTPDAFLFPFYQLFVDMLDCDDPDPTPTLTMTPTPTDEPCIDGYTPEGLPCDPPEEDPCTNDTAAAGAVPCTPTPTEDPCTDGYTPAGVPCNPDDRDDDELLPRPTLEPTATPTPDETREPKDDDDDPEPTRCSPSAVGLPCP
ncbi:MAG: hypothetical protein DWQ07_01885 [Chloroflexi bacterium]|nr:MAG: hypothetical protein DWQ07_01885 [Chloroflexota bacterium]MBL1193751.1 hypothetical protein [Chloroflexota bacterium]NOH11044.1 hypothetical protein [Chloroflexota bacterium]